jgi:hypothetical protein
MSVMYSVFPLEHRMREWLEEQNVPLPAVFGRNPTLAELQGAIASLCSHSTKQTTAVLGQSWEAFVTRNGDPESESWCIARIIKLAEGENEFYFEKGSPELIIEVLAKLAEETGPLVLVSDAGDVPLVVEAGKNAEELFLSWGE